MGYWKKEPHRSGAVFENNELALTQLLFDAFVGKFRRSADRSGNRVLHLVAHDREISLLFYANPTRPSAALYFQDENLAIRAYRIGSKTANAPLHDSLDLVCRLLLETKKHK